MVTKIGKNLIYLLSNGVTLFIWMRNPKRNEKENLNLIKSLSNERERKILANVMEYEKNESSVQSRERPEIFYSVVFNRLRVINYMRGG